MGSVGLEIIFILSGVYYLLAVVISFLVELLAVRGRWRGKFLRQTIFQFFENTEYGCEFYRHPLIRDLHSRTILGRMKLPSAISPKTFAEVAIQVLFSPCSEKAEKLEAAYVKGVLDEFRKEPAMEYPALAAKLSGFKNHAIAESKQDTALSFSKAFASHFAEHFEEMQLRLIGRYRRKVRIWTLILSGILSLTVCFDSIYTFIYLYENAGVREAMVGLTDQLADADGNKALLEYFEQAKNFPFGWGDRDFSETGLILLGLFLSTIALSLGAPFWYDVMGRVGALRKGKKQKEPVDNATLAQTGSPSNAQKHQSTAVNEELDGESEVWPKTRSAASQLKSKMDGPLTREEVILCAAFSRLVYRSTSFITNRLVETGLETFNVISLGVAHNADLQTADRNFVGDTQVMKFEDDHSVFIAFRGTEAHRMSDVWTNTRVDQVPLPGGERGETVHSGFLAALDVPMEGGKSIYESIVDQIEESREKNIYLTGHSLGGALAHLCTARYLLEKGVDLGQSPLRGCSTYGAPRIGNDKFSETSDELGKDNVIRFVNQSDLVSRIPLMSWGYHHTVQGYIYGMDNKWIGLEASTSVHRLQIWVERIQSGFRRINGTFTDPTFFLTDHAMSEYHRRIVRDF